MVSAWGWEIVSWATGVIGRENILFEEWECKDRCGSSEDKDGTVVDSIKPGHANETVRDHHPVAFMNIWAEQRLQWALYYYFCQVFQRVWDEILVPRNKMPPTGKKQKTCSSQSSLTWSHISKGLCTLRLGREFVSLMIFRKTPSQPTTFSTSSSSRLWRASVFSLRLSSPHLCFIESLP